MKIKKSSLSIEKETLQQFNEVKVINKFVNADLLLIYLLNLFEKCKQRVM